MNFFRFNWIYSKLYDTIFILAPPIICILLILIFPNIFGENATENELIWFILVVCIDVGHVYSTIYRTYLDKETINKNKLLFYSSPLLFFILGVILYSYNAIYFWRCMTYLAVFHFIRQQYGFMRIYSRNEVLPKIFKRIDAITIYSATLFPILYWHLKGKQEFNWFIDNDFLFIESPSAIPFLSILYFIIILIYLIKEVILIIKYKQFNLTKFTIILSTGLSWFLGIVYFSGDLTFTLLNVVSHGIPYYALVWAHGNKKTTKNNLLSNLFSPKYIIVFISTLLLLAYLEELIWDGLIWKEHFSIFPTSNYLPDINNNDLLLTFVVPLLCLPQILHYFIDGFIWKIQNDKYGWRNILNRN